MNRKVMRHRNKHSAKTGCVHILLLGFFLVLPVSTGNGMTADSWPEFRGPGAQGISLATNVPVSWSAGSNIAWKVALPGKGWSSPVLAAGKIYLTTACPIEGSNDVSLRVLCLSASDGRMLWNVEAIHPEASVLVTGHMKNSLASPTPIVRGGRIFAHFGHMGTACLTLDGKIVWRQQEVKYSPVHGNGGSPLLVDSALVFNCDGASNPFVAALDAETGRVKWKTPRDTPARNKFSFSTPLLIERDHSKQVVSAGSGFVAGYDPADGRELWRFRYGNGYSVVPRPVLSGDLLFISSGFDAPVLYAIRLNHASGDITSNNAAWKYAKQAPNTPSMIVVGRELYFVSDAGIASCLDSQTGAVHWSERLGGNFSASPIFAEGKIYLQNEAGVGFVIRAGTLFELISKNDLGERSLASYAVADNHLYIRTADHLWAIKH